ncbi:response regulator transcription factor [Clostridium botulinum C]|uniref:LytR/AlgR family response regulator transcription factor n=1 Tax=Clostridium TaxID=1485 RepID=UPI000EA1AC45|nr:MULTISPECIES: LytTR family DNA-binding domain-containing protein [Clostridium]AYF54836.1 DNA-binding response regulator [Clostridium novyi]MCD3244667.1 response regulator transcription factor [Clostridium botulinum C]MCD3261226.1 response regulator transcription factor [Clostridium botulinum C]
MIDIYICDDNIETLDTISKIVNTFYEKNNFKSFKISTFNNSNDILHSIKNNSNPQKIYILDIDLNERVNGLLLGRQIRKLDNYSGEMIYITNHSELGFKVFQYKLRILQFIDKTFSLAKELEDSLLTATKILTEAKRVNTEKTLKIKSGFEIFNIPLKDIICIETIKNSKKVQLSTSKNILQFYTTLKELKDELDDNFIQIHKTTIINKNFIVSINKSQGNSFVKLKNDILCPLSRNGIKEVNKHWTC